MRLYVTFMYSSWSTAVSAWATRAARLNSVGAVLGSLRIQEQRTYMSIQGAPARLFW